MPSFVEKPKKYTSLMFVAPTGWGKTRLLSELKIRTGWDFLLVSPLKAIEVEFNLKNKNLRAVTAEKLPRYLDKNDFNGVAVIDEVHLWTHWGDTFRSLLWEALFCLLNRGVPILFLTATLSDEVKKEFTEILNHGEYSLEVLDFGNFQNSIPPSKEFSFQLLGKKPLTRRLLWELDRGEKVILFCRYRTEVQDWEQFLVRNGFKVLTCVGGESLRFKDRLESEPRFQIIVSTSVLSHGVNIPGISRVFFNYEIEDRDFYIQMKGRAGRFGERYEVFSYQKGESSIWNMAKLWCFDRYLRLFYA